MVNDSEVNSFHLVEIAALIDGLREAIATQMMNDCRCRRLGTSIKQLLQYELSQ